MKYKVHRFDLKMNREQGKLEEYLNGLKGEIISVVPHITMKFFWIHGIDYVLVIEKMRNN